MFPFLNLPAHRRCGKENDPREVGDRGARLPGLAPDRGHPGAEGMGSVKDIRKHLQQSRIGYDGKREHAGSAGQCSGEGRLGIPDAHERGESPRRDLKICYKMPQGLPWNPCCKSLIPWWALQDSNLRLPPCEGGMKWPHC